MQGRRDLRPRESGSRLLGSCEDVQIPKGAESCHVGHHVDEDTGRDDVAGRS
jgi:hypothetical protein